MKRKFDYFFEIIRLSAVCIILAGCSESGEKKSFFVKNDNLTGEYIYRKDEEHFIVIPPAECKSRTKYPWELHHSYAVPQITKEYFRCKGTGNNPEKKLFENDAIKNYRDCEGKNIHGLPLREGKEFVYPILISLLNHVQKQTNRRVIITGGHRCPIHNDYVDPSNENKYSKHQLGAEVSFYVAGFENEPEKITDILRDYYLTEDENKYDPEFTGFRVYENSSNISMAPLYNKEIFIKVFEKK